MREFRLRSDLHRQVIDGFALPLGFESATMAPPRQGYCVDYNSGEEDEPDTYTFQVVVSHERLAELCRRCFELLPPEVYAVVEIDSLDAYRSVDVYIGSEPIGQDQFRKVWNHFESFLLEDVSIAAGATSEEPYLEVFIDRYKTVVIHAPLEMRDEVEAILHDLGLEEVEETWPEEAPDTELPKVRPVLEEGEGIPDMDDLLLQLREYLWLDLDVDPEANVDDAGRELGLTLWHAVVIVYPKDASEEEMGASLTVWLTAGSISEAEQMVRRELETKFPQWQYGVSYVMDRIAHDERPDELGDLAPRPTHSRVHLLRFDAFRAPTAESDRE